ncbi:MAG TPA: helix-turn-helix domain-containing protein [Patescibacteria group bacterium]|nr:helix-turn-helix domain-containing protein [Patescibacteria group bacterium]
MVRKPHFNSGDGLSDLYILDSISGKWTVLVVYILSERTMRHSELQRAVGGISQKVLTQTLRNLERNGVVTRTIYPVVPPQVEYSLTPLGRSLVGVLSDLCMWAKGHHLEVEQARNKYDAIRS